MIRIRNVFLIAFPYLLMACATPKLDIPSESSTLRDSDIKTACSHPETYDARMNPHFQKYGCYCGENYPNIKRENKTEEEYIREYYLIEPKDEIDRACRDHDICYIKFPNNTGACNERLTNRIRKLGYGYFPTLSLSQDNHICYATSNHTMVVFETMFASNFFPENRLKEAWSKTVFLVATPVEILFQLTDAALDTEFADPTLRCMEGYTSRIGGTRYYFHDLFPHTKQYFRKALPSKKE